MSTLITTPSNTLAKIRWHEQYVSEGLNKKHNGIVPAGIVRGGNLVENLAVDLTVKVQADPLKGDSIYSFIDANGAQLTFRQSGDVTLDLTAVAGTTVFVGLLVTYVVSSDTVVEWRAYSQAEVDADPTIVVLGRVVVPGAGAIPASAIVPLERRDAWYDKAPGMRDWHQVVRNGSFEVATNGVLTSDDEDEPIGWRGSSISGTAVELSISTADALTGLRSLKVSANGNTSYTYLVQEASFACKPGDRIRVSMWVAGDAVSAGGFGDLCIYLNYYTAEAVSLSAVTMCQAGAEDGTFDFTEFDDIVTAPANAAFVRLSIRARNASGAATGDYYVDDVRMWIEAGHAAYDDKEGRGLIGQVPPLSSLDLAPRGLVTTDMADWVAHLLRLRYDAEVSSVFEYEWKHRNGALDWLLKLIGGGIRVERLLDSDAHAAEARVEAPFRTGAIYTLMFEFENLTASRGWIRVYATNQASPASVSEAFTVTVNAKWDGTQWVRDINTRDSSRFDVGLNGIDFCFYDDALADTWTDSQWWSVGERTLLVVGSPAGSIVEIPPTSDYGFSAVRDGNYITFSGGDFQPTTDLSSPIYPEWSRSALNRAYPEIASTAAIFLNFPMLKDGDIIEELILATSYASGTAFDWELHEVEFHDPAAAPTDTTLATGTTGTTVGWNTDVFPLTEYVVKGTSNMRTYYLLIWSPVTLGSSNFVAGGMLRYQTDKAYV